MVVRRTSAGVLQASAEGGVRMQKYTAGSEMSADHSGDFSSGTRRSHSAPHRHFHKDQKPKRSQSLSVSSSGDSTRSLLSPLYHSSFEDEDDEKLDSSRSRSDYKENVETRVGPQNVKGSKTEKDHVIIPGHNLTPWEEWLVSKGRRERIQLQSKVLEELKQNQESEKIRRQQELHKLAAEEQHKEWVRKKNEQEKKEKELKMLKEQKEKEAKERHKAEMEEKAKEKFNEWLKKKQAEEKEKKRKEKEEEEKRLAKLNEKKQKSKLTFEEWLENAKSKPRPVLNSYGYANGKLTGYYDGSASPAPGFCNPIPWKPINVPPPPREVRRNTVKPPKRRMANLSYRPRGRVQRPMDHICIGAMAKM
ncbi:coiled-coil domain-containing protein 34 isoform X1 [Pleurodeles waltl]|uniref:coiled-coil domain-containing protein 34 isoform X1 n=2 Tax=Pleurodeles waltl TaxID=8319 RepID=UPI003709A20B